MCVCMFVCIYIYIPLDIYRPSNQPYIPYSDLEAQESSGDLKLSSLATLMAVPCPQQNYPHWSCNALGAADGGTQQGRADSARIAPAVSSESLEVTQRFSRFWETDLSFRICFG